MADEHAGGASAGGAADQSPGSEDPQSVSGQPSLPLRPNLCGFNALQARYPPGTGEKPLPDYQGRASWHLISTYDGALWPKPGEVCLVVPR